VLVPVADLPLSWLCPLVPESLSRCHANLVPDIFDARAALGNVFCRSLPDLSVTVPLRMTSPLLTLTSISLSIKIGTVRQSFVIRPEDGLGR
jgi:hypothetical protein